jgi:hypothetical protein
VTRRSARGTLFSMSGFSGVWGRSPHWDRKIVLDRRPLGRFPLLLVDALRGVFQSLGADDYLCTICKDYL